MSDVYSPGTLLSRLNEKSKPLEVTNVSAVPKVFSAMDLYMDRQPILSPFTALKPEHIQKLNPEAVKKHAEFVAKLGYNGVLYRNGRHYRVFELIAKYGWDKWNSSFRRRSGKSMNEAVKQLQQWTTSRRGLMLVGGVGIGKTHALKSLCVEQATKGVTFALRTYAEIIEGLMDFKTDKETKTLVTTGYGLVIDDFGIGAKSETATTKLFQVLVERQNKGYKTFMSSNLTPNQIADRYPPYIVSRMRELMKVILVDGPDYRKKIDDEGGITNGTRS